MSEQSFPFGSPGGGVGVAEPPATEVEETEAKGRRPLIWIVGGAVVLVVALAGYFLLFSGGSSSDSTVAAPVQPSAVPSTAASTAPSTAPAVIPPTAKSTTGRDPFKPLVVAPPPSTAAAPSAVPTASAAASTGVPAVPATGGPAVFSVVSIDSKAGTAVTTVDGVKYTAAVGQTFATYFKLVAVNVSTPCGVFQYGDASMNLCAKQTVSLS